MKGIISENELVDRKKDDARPAESGKGQGVENAPIFCCGGNNAIEASRDEREMHLPVAQETSGSGEKMREEKTRQS